MKQASEIYESMMSVFQERTGFSAADSSDISVRLYAAAAEIESLYSYCDWALNQSFPQTASGEHLDRHAELRALRRKDAARAEGSLLFSLDEPRGEAVTVPEGTVCTDGGLVRFVTAAEGVIPAGELNCRVPARAEEPGPAGNAASGTVTGMVQPPVGVTGCTNPDPFTGGADAEDDAALRQRILESFRRLPNGANAAFYEARVRAFDQVAGVEVLPRNRGIGTVDVVVAATPAAPADLLTQIRQDLESVREIAVNIQVLEPETVPVDLAVTVWPKDQVTGAEAAAAVQAALQGFFTGELLGKPVFLAQLGSVIYGTGTVKNYVITAPAGDIPAAAGSVPVLGSLTVTEGV